MVAKFDARPYHVRIFELGVAFALWTGIAVDAPGQDATVKPVPHAASAGLSALIADDDPEWVKISEELGKLPLSKVKDAWIANEKQMAERAIAEQKAREELWKVAADARQADARCVQIRAEIEKLRRQLEEAALQSPTAAAADAKVKDAHRAFLLAVKKRQHLGLMMRDLTPKQVETITKEADAVAAAVERPAVSLEVTGTNKSGAAARAVKP